MEKAPGSDSEWAQAGRTLPGLAALFCKYAKAAGMRAHAYAKVAAETRANIESREGSLCELQRAVANAKRAPRREVGAVKLRVEQVLRSFQYPTTLTGSVFSSLRSLVDEYSTMRGEYARYVESVVALCNCFDFVTRLYTTLTSGDAATPVDTKAWFMQMFAEQVPRGVLQALNERIDVINVGHVDPRGCRTPALVLIKCVCMSRGEGG